MPLRVAEVEGGRSPSFVDRTRCAPRSSSVRRARSRSGTRQLRVMPAPSAGAIVARLASAMLRWLPSPTANSTNAVVLCVTWKPSTVRVEVDGLARIRAVEDRVRPVDLDATARTRPRRPRSPSSCHARKSVIVSMWPGQSTGAASTTGPRGSSIAAARKKSRRAARCALRRSWGGRLIAAVGSAIRSPSRAVGRRTHQTSTPSGGGGDDDETRGHLAQFDHLHGRNVFASDGDRLRHGQRSHDDGSNEHPAVDGDRCEPEGGAGQLEQLGRRERTRPATRADDLRADVRNRRNGTAASIIQSATANRQPPSPATVIDAATAAIPTAPASSARVDDSDCECRTTVPRQRAVRRRARGSATRHLPTTAPTHRGPRGPRVRPPRCASRDGARERSVPSLVDHGELQRRPHEERHERRRPDCETGPGERDDQTEQHRFERQPPPAVLGRNRDGPPRRTLGAGVRTSTRRSTGDRQRPDRQRGQRRHQLMARQLPRNV